MEVFYKDVFGKITRNSIENTHSCFDVHGHPGYLSPIKLPRRGGHVGEHVRQHSRVTSYGNNLNHKLNNRDKQSKSQRADKGCLRLLLLRSHCLLFLGRGTAENHRFPFCAEPTWAGIEVDNQWVVLPFITSHAQGFYHRYLSAHVGRASLEII